MFPRNCALGNQTLCHHRKSAIFSLSQIKKCQALRQPDIFNVFTLTITVLPVALELLRQA